MPGAVFLEGERVTLRTVEEDDLPFFRDVVNDPLVRKYLPSDPTNLRQKREFFEERIIEDDGWITLLVCADGEPMGTVRLYSRNDVSRSSEVGIILAPEYWGNGYGTEASKLIVDYGFREKCLHRIMARVLSGNEGSKNIWEKLGFAREGTFRDAAFIGGEYVDVLFYGILADEWFTRREE